MSEGLAIWADALLVARLVAADPHGCGGVVLRAGAGPVRDRWLEILRENLNPGKPLRRMPAGIAEDRLVGGLDLAATLAAGRPVAQAGLLAEADGGYSSPRWRSGWGRAPPRISPPPSIPGG